MIDDADAFILLTLYFDSEPCHFTENLTIVLHALWLFFVNLVEE
jgi:hypothetical protein